MRLRYGIAAALGCALVSLLASAGDAVKLDVKLGLWQVTSTGKAEGAIPEEMLARVPPERRAEMIAAMQANAAKPHTSKQCLTAAKLAKGFDLGGGRDDQSCQRTVVSNSSTEMTVRQECTRAEGKQTVTAHFHADSPGSVTGNINAVMTRGGQSMSFDREIHAKWLSASCGGVKDDDGE